MGYDLARFVDVTIIGLAAHICSINIFNIVFLFLLGGMITTFVLAKKEIDKYQWKWKVLFGAEVCALLYAMVASQWWKPLVNFFSEDFACCARVSMILYLTQFLITMVVWRRLLQSR